MDSPRESYRAFPRWTSRFWTWLTGKPEQGQAALVTMTPASYATCSVLTYVAGLGLGVGSFRLDGLAFAVVLTLGWIMTVNGARRMISTIAHQCIHGRFSGNGDRDQRVAQWFAFLTLTQSAMDYRREHFGLHHRADVFATAADPAARFLGDAGLAPPKSVAGLWLALLIAIVSPRFHAVFFAARIRSLMESQSRWRWLCTVMVWSGLIGLICWMCSVRAAFFGLIVPVVVLYQISVLLEFISEHAWFVERGVLAQPKYVHATHSWGRFCGRSVPCRRGDSVVMYALRWMVWVLEHALYHLPVRLTVLPGDLPQHDFHHRNPGTMRWPNATYAREDDVKEGDPRWPPYSEFWGLHNAIAHVFAGIAAAQAYPKNAPSASSATGMEGARKADM
jgi:hypothetical protein